MSSKRKSDVWLCVRDGGDTANTRELQVCAKCGIETWCYIDPSSRKGEVAESNPEEFFPADEKTAAGNSTDDGESGDDVQIEAEDVEEEEEPAPSVEPVEAPAEDKKSLDEMNEEELRAHLKKLQEGAK